MAGQMFSRFCQILRSTRGRWSIRTVLIKQNTLFIGLKRSRELELFDKRVMVGHVDRKPDVSTFHDFSAPCANEKDQNDDKKRNSNQIPTFCTKNYWNRISRTDFTAISQNFPFHFQNENIIFKFC